DRRKPGHRRWLYLRLTNRRQHVRLIYRRQQGGTIMKFGRILGGVAFAALLASPITAQTLRYATVSEPPSLDIQMGTATLASTIGQHVFETLYAFDASAKPQPFLATGETISDDEKTITISLRDGVMFHDGDVMTAEDVAASLNRWSEFGSRGKLLGLEKAEATGPLEVTLTLTAPNGAWK